MQSCGDGGKLDASNLMIPIVGFVSHDDPRARATSERTISDLSADGPSTGTSPMASTGSRARRRRSRSAPSGSSSVSPARELFERLLGFCNDVGLLTEEIDPHSGEQIGNFPQAFSHVGLIQAAIALDLPEESMSMMTPRASAAAAKA